MDVEGIQAYAANPDSLFFDGPTALRHSSSWGEKRYAYLDTNEPDLRFSYFLPQDDDVTVRVKDKDGVVFYEQSIEGSKGFGYWHWNGKSTDEYLSKGDYKIDFIQGKTSKRSPDGMAMVTHEFEVR